MDLNELYKEIEKAEIDLNAKRLKYIKEALVENGGSIKLKFKECEKIKRFLEIAEGYPVDVDWETQGFYHCNDAGTLPGECADFIFHKCND